MLKEEQIKEVVDELEKVITDAGLKPRIVYDSNFKITDPRSGTQLTIDGVVIGVNKYRYAQYPHIEVKMLSNLREIGNAAFTKEEYAGDPLAEYKLENFGDGIMFPLDKFADFTKDAKATKIKASVYLNEKKALEEQLEMVNNIIKENDIKED